MLISLLELNHNMASMKSILEVMRRIHYLNNRSDMNGEVIKNNLKERR